MYATPPLRELHMKFDSKIHLTYDDVQSMCKYLEGEIARFKPDIIVGIVYLTIELHIKLANKVPETTDDKATRKGFKHTEETKKRMSEIRKGRYQFGGVKHHSDESRKKMSDHRKGRKLTNEDKRKKSEAHKGKPKTEEHKLALRKPKAKVECSICGRIIGSHNIKRHQSVCNSTSSRASYEVR